MPEGLEAEMYRRALVPLIGMSVTEVEIDDRQPEADEIRAELPGHRVIGVGRRGKLVWLDLDGASASTPASGSTPACRLGIHFGMSGRLVVDDHAVIDQLVYSSGRWNSEWDRLRVRFRSEVDDEEHELSVNDPRRWSRFSLDPNPERLGPDLVDSDVFEPSGHALADRLRGRTAALKSVLLDQCVVAGLGNMLVDELLMRADLAPHRSVADLQLEDIRRLSRVASEALPRMLRDGGSHTGMLGPDHRSHLGPCPSCGKGGLERTIVGGRSTVWCPAHQRLEAHQRIETKEL